MSILQGAVTSYKVGLLNGQFNFGTGTTQVFKIALYTGFANLDSNTTSYIVDSEVSGGGYTTGGEVLTISQVPTSSETTAYISFDPAIWTGASFTARGALVYLADGLTNPAVFVLDFGSDKVPTAAGVFTVTFPTANATSAILRLN
jgi:hypothetical protein